MTEESAVLVLTAQFDPTADRVVDHLNRRDVPVFRCDMAEFPQQLTVSATLGSGSWTAHLRTPHRRLSLDTVRSAYFRRPGRFVFPDDMQPAARRFAQAEARAGVGGIIAGLDCFWLNHPGRVADAEYKPVQMQVASACGLSVPRSLITNDPDAARSFIGSIGGPVIYKPFSGLSLVKDGAPASLLTSIIQHGESPDPRIALTTHLFQEWVPKQYDVRLTVVRNNCFAVAINIAGSKSATIDWRADYSSHRYAEVVVPTAVEHAIATMLGRLGLNFGAFDFVITPDNEWVFLEVNPNGQWGWLEGKTGLPISSAIADALEEGCRVP